MARTFDGAGDEIQVSIGGCNLTGAFTVVVVARRNSAATAYHNLCTAHTSANAAVYGLEIENNADGNQLQVQVGATFVASTFTVGTADSWCLLAGGKASGTTTPRMHKYVYNTDTWTHQNASGTAGNPTSTASGTVRFGLWQNTDDLDGDLAAAAIFDRNLSDGEVEQMAHSLQDWLALGPVGMWVFDQQATGTAVNDWTGNGAQQSSVTGTSVATSSVIGLSYGHEPNYLSSSAATGGTSATATPDVVTAVAALPRPDVNVVAGPVAVAGVATLPRPDVSVVAGPAVVTSTVAVPQPAVNVVASPAAVTAVVSVPTPTVSAGGSVTAAPAAVAVVSTVPQPAVNVTAGPVVVPVTITAPPPALNVTAGPSVVTATVALARPNVNIAAGPAATSVVASAPGVAVNVTVGATVVPCIVAVPTPSAGGTTTATPATVTVTVAVPRAAINVTAGPAVVPVVVTVPLPSLPGQIANADSVATVAAAVASVAAVSALRTSTPTVTAAESTSTVG